jgi:putative ABC transport system permease protein
MLKNYLKIAFRNLKKQKLYSFINVLGLAMGVAACLVIFLFIQHEYSFDRFHDKADRIYRLEEIRYQKQGVSVQTKSMFDTRAPEGVFTSAYLPLPMGPVLENRFPEIERVVRMSSSNGLVRRDDIVFEESITFVDSTFFEMFSFPLVRGEAASVLNTPGSVVITWDMAKKYFGNESPVGQELVVKLQNKEKVYTVTGVADNPPANSSFPFDILIPIQNRPFYDMHIDRWTSFNTPLFLELLPGTDVSKLKEKLDAFAHERFKADMESMRTRLGLPEDARVFELALTPLNEIHLKASVEWPRVSNPLYSYILGGIAILILLIACINYVMLALARSSGRVLEVGIRKASGARSRQIATQFWGETQLLTVLALVAGVGLAELILPFFNELAGKSLSIHYLQDAGFLVVLLGIALVIGLAAGSYPAAVLARYNPVSVLKGRRTLRFKPRLTKALLVVQYSLSIFLIVSSLIMFRQMDYVSSKDIGYDKEQVLFLPTHTGWTEEGTALMERFRSELTTVEGVAGVSGMAPAFTKGSNRYGFKIGTEYKNSYIYYVDEHLVETLGMELVAGRNFSEDRPTDVKDAIIVNQSLVEAMGWENPIGEQLPWKGQENPSTVIGVVKDFHFQSMEASIEPMLFHMDPEQGGVNDIAVKIKAGMIDETLPQLKQAWAKVAPFTPFDYWFLDDAVAQQYSSYRKWMRIMGISTFVAILIACMGLFGLAGITAVNKTKEIGIRKVLGAGVQQIILLLNKDLVKLVLVSLLLAAPLSWYIMNRWLTDFAYRIEIGPGVFLASAVAVLVIAVATVSYHSVKAALINPVESLRSE